MSGYEGKGKEAFSGEIVRRQQESEMSLEKYCSVTSVNELSNFYFTSLSFKWVPVLKAVALQTILLKLAPLECQPPPHTHTLCSETSLQPSCL